MSFYLSRNDDWPGGYRAVALLQMVLTVILFCSLPLWKRMKADPSADSGADSLPPLPMRTLLRQKGVWQALMTFFCYCALESTAGLWASSFLVHERGVDAGTAARFASLFYIGITAGRALCGFVSERLGDHRMIRLGCIGIAAGVILLLLPLPRGFALAGLITVGFGCAPIYPSQIHATPQVFGRAHAQALIGMQMAAAYVGTTLMPPLFGLCADSVGLGMFPLYLLLFLVLMALLTEQVHGARIQTGK
jgi:fucose permease